MPVIDLHAHTKYSDGTTTPAEMVYLYIKAGVSMLAVTDHDTTEAVEEARQKTRAAGLLFVPGVEISTREHDYLHILGYNIDVNNQGLQAFLRQNRDARDMRVKKIIELLRQNGLDITRQDVYALVKKAPSRAHVADAMVKKGFAANRHEAFKKYLVEGRPAHVPCLGPEVTEVIAQIKKAGGKAFIAHPGVVKDIWAFPRWVNAGLEGIEAYYPSHSQEMMRDLLSIAKKYNLLVSAGSDFHGEKSGRLCKPGLSVPQEVFLNLKTAFFDG